MADKETKLSIVIRTVDRATAGINAISARLDKLTRPVRSFKKALGELREKSGLDDVIGGFNGVGSAVAGVLAKVALIGGAIAAATAGLLSIIGGFDDLGDKAVKIGVGVDFLASFRFAAERAGASVAQADQGLESFGKNIGLARAGMGRMVPFLRTVSPVLLKQLLATKSNEEAVLLFANAMSKIQDPAKRMALASKVFGDTALAPLLSKGAAGVDELQKRFLQLAGSQKGAADAAGETDDALKDLKASSDGVKAALVKGLAPALTVIIKRMTDWLVAHRGDIERWAVDIGTRIPDAVENVVETVRGVASDVATFIDRIGGIKTVMIAVAAAIVGPVLTSLLALGAALLTNPVGLIVTGIAGAALLIVKYWEPIKAFFTALWDSVVAVFEKAWEIISAITDKVAKAVEAITGSIDIQATARQVREAAGPTADQLGARAAAARDAATGSNSETLVKVDFANAPPGTRVSADPRGTATVDLSVGYQIFGLP